MLITVGHTRLRSQRQDQQQQHRCCLHFKAHLLTDQSYDGLTLLIHSGSWNFVQRASHPEPQLSACTKIWCQGAQDDGRAPGSMIVHALAGRRTLGATGAALTMDRPAACAAALAGSSALPTPSHAERRRGSKSAASSPHHQKIS